MSMPTTSAERIGELLNNPPDSALSRLLAILRANPQAIVLADGFSCRKQVKDLETRDAMTLGELLAAHRA